MATTPTIHIAQHQANLTDAGSQSDPAIVDIGMGRYIVVWTEAGGGPIATAAGSDLVGQIFDEAGNRIGNEFQVNTSHFADDERTRRWLPGSAAASSWSTRTPNANGTSIRVDVRDVNGDLVDGIADHDPGRHQRRRPLQPGRGHAPRRQLPRCLQPDRVTADGFTDIVGKIVGADGTVGAEFLIADIRRRGGNADIAVLSNGNYVIVFQNADDATLA